MATVYNGEVPTPSLMGFTIPLTAALGGFFGLIAGQSTGLGGLLGIASGAVAGAVIAYVLISFLSYKIGRLATIIVVGLIGVSL